MPGSVGGHVKGTGEHLKVFFIKSLYAPMVSSNVIFSIILALAAMEQFGRTHYHDVIRFSDASFAGSVSVFNESGTNGVAVVPSNTLAHDSLCHDGSDTCFVGTLQMGRSGMFGQSFMNLEQIEFNLPHMMWMAAWFTTPISLFLLANATWKVFEQWMWFGLYLFIGIWDIVGLSFMIFWHSSPLYNKILAFVYFAFSGLLMHSVRETWRVLVGDVEGGAVDGETIGPMKGQRKTMYGNPAVPPFMQKISMGRMDSVAKPVYMLAAENPVTDIPVVVAHTFTRSVLILTEMFFLIPVVATTAFVMAQERVIPFDVQMRSWQTALLFGVVVILEKARKTRLSYVTDTTLAMAASVCVAGVLWFVVPEFWWFSRNVPAHLGPSLMYFCFLLFVAAAIVNVLVNLIFITFIGKDPSKLKEFQDADTAPLSDENPDENPDAAVSAVTNYKKNTGNHYAGAVNGMYYMNIAVLAVVKLLLVIVVLRGHLTRPETF